MAEVLPRNLLSQLCRGKSLQSFALQRSILVKSKSLKAFAATFHSHSERTLEKLRQKFANFNFSLKPLWHSPSESFWSARTKIVRNSSGRAARLYFPPRNVDDCALCRGPAPARGVSWEWRSVSRTQLSHRKLSLAYFFTVLTRPEPLYFSHVQKSSSQMLIF